MQLCESAYMSSICYEVVALEINFAEFDPAAPHLKKRNQ